MKNFPPDLLEGVIEPIIIVGVAWSVVSPAYFSTRAVSINGHIARVNIVDVGPYVNSKQANNLGSTASISISIMDVDGMLKTMMDHAIIERAPASVFLAFGDTGNYIPLVGGQVVGPVSWDEGTRIVSFQVATVIESKEIGFSPTADDLGDINPQAEGQPWPMIFGKCAHVPCVKARVHHTGYLQADIDLLSDLYKFEEDAGTFKWLREENIKVESFFGDEAETGKLYVENGTSFRQNTEIKISIDGVIFKGKFNDNIFTVSQANCPKFEGKDFGDRDGTDEENDNPQLAWVKDDNVNIAGHHIYAKTSASNVWYNYCIKQEKKKCTFKFAWFDIFNDDPASRKTIKLTSEHKIERAYACTEGGLVSQEIEALYTMFAQEKRKRDNQQGPALTNAQKKQAYGTLRGLLDEMKRQPGAFWLRSAGEKVKLYTEDGSDDPDIYIVSGVECRSIDAVYGIKRIRAINGNEMDVFAPVPKDYYRKQLRSNYDVNGERASALLFDKPLDEYKEEGWQDRVWVTATSTVGPNPADIIEWAIRNHTNLSPIHRSFQDAKDNFDDDLRADFVLMNSIDGMSFAKSVAWQARCALRIDLGQAELVFLPKVPDQLVTFDEEETEQDTLICDYTETIDIKTRFLARWRETSRHQRGLHTKSKLTNLISRNADVEVRDERVTVYKNNISAFGDIPEEYDIYIYNQKQWVEQPLFYWGYLESNSWRKATLKCFHRGICLQPWDGVYLQYTNNRLGALSGLIGIVESVNYDFKEKSTTLTLWLASRSGTFANDTRVFNA